ncbi:hypothetical protein NK718_21145 [Alsobacter sp. SYSU M60028]|uniref:Sodium/calcium exchanger membrane region domain-containing protein n=1 Tax=Alsobacter ponti TaxID=2962936 RepID=A0ABT1LIT5_9HYPH|nr:hypothetical protein [Alsobacter ponti]MCP8941036.1 hypothetical protein [Alsobacter ponti]
MSPTPAGHLPIWTWTVPLLALAVLAAAFGFGLTTLLAVVAGLALMGAVFAAVHHAEVVAHRVGEPFGTLVLAVAVTVIEVALIVSMMWAGGPDKAGLPRETVFAAVMIICNGLVGLCLLAGGWRHREQSFQLQGALSALGVLAALVTLPESVSALRAARRNLLQTSMNLALGSALASIGLTIPVVAVLSIAIGQPLAMGLGTLETTLLALTLLLSVITLGTGRTTVLQGIVHLAVFAAFLFFSVIP